MKAHLDYHRGISAMLLSFVLLAGACSARAPAGVACGGEEVALVREGVLTVGSDLGLPPFGAVGEDGEPEGFEIELLRGAATRMNLEIRVLPQTYPGLIPSLLTRRYDVAAGGLRSGEDLQAQACITTAHLEGRLALVTLAGAELEGADQLEGRRVGVERATSAAAWARAHLEGRAEHVLLYPAPEDPFLALGAGEVQAVVADEVYAAHRIAAGEPLEIVETMGPTASHVFATHVGNKGLRDALDAALGMLREDGAHDRIQERWLGR